VDDVEEAKIGEDVDGSGSGADDGGIDDDDFLPLSVVAGVFDGVAPEAVVLDVGGSGGAVVGFALHHSGVEDGEVEPGGTEADFGLEAEAGFTGEPGALVGDGGIDGGEGGF